MTTSTKNPDATLKKLIILIFTGVLFFSVSSTIYLTLNNLNINDSASAQQVTPTQPTLEEKQPDFVGIPLPTASQSSSVVSQSSIQSSSNTVTLDPTTPAPIVTTGGSTEIPANINPGTTTVRSGGFSFLVFLVVVIGLSFLGYANYTNSQKSTVKTAEKKINSKL